MPFQKTSYRNTLYIFVYYCASSGRGLLGQLQIAGSAPHSRSNFLLNDTVAHLSAGHAGRDSVQPQPFLRKRHAAVGEYAKSAVETRASCCHSHRRHGAGRCAGRFPRNCLAGALGLPADPHGNVSAVLHASPGRLARRRLRLARKLDRTSLAARLRATPPADTSGWRSFTAASMRPLHQKAH